MEKAFKKRFVILVLPTLIAFIIAFILDYSRRSRESG